MKSKILKLILFLMAIVALHSCSQFQRITVIAPKDTKIISPKSYGKTNVTSSGDNDIISLDIVNRTNYQGYMIVTDPQTGLNVPYGINIKDFKKKGKMSAFLYEDKQYVDYGHLSTTLLHPDPEKEVVTAPAKSDASPSSDAATGSKTNRTKSDSAKKISGTYNGSGKLLYGSKTDENYPKISIVIERVDKNHVSVKIVENGEEFFSEPLIYTVVDGHDNTYSLEIENVPDATIAIDDKGNCIFTHKQVNIDDEIYTLSITAKKEK